MIHNNEKHSVTCDICIHLYPTDIVTKDIDISRVRKLIRKVLAKNYAALEELSIRSLPHLAEELFATGLISRKVVEGPTFDGIISEFMAGISFKTSLNELQEYLSIFLISLNKLGGSYAAASRVLQNEWTEITKRELNIELHFTHWSSLHSKVYFIIFDNFLYVINVIGLLPIFLSYSLQTILRYSCLH